MSSNTFFPSSTSSSVGFISSTIYTAAKKLELASLAKNIISVFVYGCEENYILFYFWVGGCEAKFDVVVSPFVETVNNSIWNMVGADRRLYNSI